MSRLAPDLAAPTPAGPVQQRYAQLFHSSPIAMCEVDWSGGRRRVDAIRNSGVDDLDTWFDDHPDELVAVASEMVIVDMNQAALTMYRARSIVDFQPRLGDVFGPDSLRLLKAHVLSRMSGHGRWEAENVHYSLAGDRLYVQVIATASEESEDSWHRILFSLSDITRQKQAELLRDAQRLILEQLAADDPIDELIDALVTEIENQSPNLHACVARIDPATFQLHLMSSASVAGEVTTLLDRSLALHVFPDSAAEELRLASEDAPVASAGHAPALTEAIRRTAACCGYRHTVLAPVINADGLAVAVLAIFRNGDLDFTAHEEEVITDFRRVASLIYSHYGRREALVTRTSELQSIFETYPDALIRVAADGTILELYSGRAMGDELGVNGSWTRNTIGSLVSSEDGHRFRDAMRRVADGSCQEFVEFYLYDIVDGTQSFEARFVPLTENGQQIVIFRDVTRLKETERALDQASERFRYLFDSSPDAIFVESPDGVVLDANHAACDLHLMHREELLGCTVFDLIPDDDREAAAGRVMPLMSGEITEFESNSLRGDGSAIPVSVRISTITYDGKPALLLHVRDIRERLEEESRRRQQELQMAHVSRLTMMGQIVAGIAHEIRQPLWSISTFVDVCHEALARDDAIDRLPRIRELIERLVKETRRVNTITSRMFSFARKGMPGRTPVQADDLVEEAVGILESRARTNAIEITVDLPDDPVTILCDRVLIEQTLVNLLNNACSALASGDRLQIRNIHIAVDQRLDLVRFRVIDNGPGLPEGLVPEQLFEGFFTTSDRGMGIGLALCHSFVEDHGGTIKAETNESGGMTFEFTLRIDGESNGSH